MHWSSSLVLTITAKKSLRWTSPRLTKPHQASSRLIKPHRNSSFLTRALQPSSKPSNLNKTYKLFFTTSCFFTTHLNAFRCHRNTYLTLTKSTTSMHQWLIRVDEFWWGVMSFDEAFCVLMTLGGAWWVLVKYIVD